MDRRGEGNKTLLGGVVILMIICCIFAGQILVHRYHMRTESVFSRRTEANFYSLDLEMLNTTLTETYSLEKGDSILVSMAQVEGDLSICIGMKGQNPVYEGDGKGLGDFTVNIQETGDYEISVTGKWAQGNLSFSMSSRVRTVKERYLAVMCAK